MFFTGIRCWDGNQVCGECRPQVDTFIQKHLLILIFIKLV